MAIGFCLKGCIDMSDRDLLLMCGDSIVMTINMNKKVFSVKNYKLMPYQIRSSIWRNELKYINGMDIDEYAVKKAQEMSDKQSNLLEFLSGRVLSIDRKNAKQILNAMLITQGQDIMSKFKVSLLCRSVSVLDNYWIKLEGDSTKWEDINVRENSLNKIVAHVALHGTSLTLQGVVTTPELTTHGAYAKCWRRENGKLYLIKAGNERGLEPKLEIQASRVLDKTNVRHIVYEPTTSNGLFCSKCECMTNNNISLIDARDFMKYCTNNNLNVKEAVFKIDSDMMYKMGIVDYIIGNSDRHDGNWGFLYSSETMRILGCHPLYDHNNAFNAYILANDDKAKYVFNGENMLEWARYCVKNTDFRFIAPLKRSDFYFDYHCDAVAERASKLGIAVKIEK